MVQYFGLEGAQEMVAEAKKLWPELEITSDNVLRLKKRLDESGIALRISSFHGLSYTRSTQLDRTANPDAQRMNHFVRIFRNTMSLIVWRYGLIDRRGQGHRSPGRGHEQDERIRTAWNDHWNTAPFVGIKWVIKVWWKRYECGVGIDGP